MAKRFVLSTTGFKGLDERAGSSTAVQSLPKLVNMRVNESGALEKRNGYSVLNTVVDGKPVTALWKGILDDENCIIAACDNSIYITVDNGYTFDKLATTADTVSGFIPFGGKLYCLGGGLYRCTGQSAYEVSGYVPTIAVSCSTGGSGTLLESPNMLTPKRRVLYNGDATNVTYRLPEAGIAAIESIKINKNEVAADTYTLVGNIGTVEFNTPPSEGLNNVEIIYSVENNDEVKRIISACRYAVSFESRLFLYGNPDYPDRVYHSEPADGIPSCEHFTELSYHAFEKPVTSLIPCYNRLLVFFEDSACFTFAELKTDSLGVSYTSFPVYELHSSKGNIAMGIGCAVENTPVTICRDGLNRWVSTAIADERSANVFSQRAFRFVADIPNFYQGTLLFNRKSKSELWLCTPKGTLIYNYALDCFYTYSLNNIHALFEVGDALLLGMEDGKVCLFSDEYRNDGDTPVVSEFETPFCTFGAPFSPKSLYGISLSFTGTDAVEASMRFIKGNANNGQTEACSFSLPEIEKDGCRKVQKRLNLKRFYSAKLCFSSECDKLTVTDLHIFGKHGDGALRLN